MMRALLTTTAARAFDGGYTPTAEQVALARDARSRGTNIVQDPMLKRSADSIDMLDYWDRVDAIMDGIDGLRGAAERYLPKFKDETPDDYALRLKLSKATNVFSDIVEGLASKPFEQNVTLRDPEKVPAEIIDFTYDVDGSGNTLTSFAGETFFNGVGNAIDWICVDYPKRDPSVRNMADAKARGYRPYWSHILGRNVLEARSEIIGGNELLTYVRIHEPGDPDRVRVYERGTDGVVTWALYVKSDTAPANVGETQFILDESGTLSINVIPMVPFYTGRRIGRRWKFVPAMKAAAELQIELYQQESGLKFAKTLTAYPMLAANGIQPPLGVDGKPDLKVAVGPNRVLWSKADGSGNIGNWKYIEPQSESLKFLAEDIKSTISELRELGRQPLTAQSGNITVITAAVAAGKAKSAVKAWAYTLQNALENAILITNKYFNVVYDPSVYVFTEFDEFTEGEDLSALNEARKDKDISRETLWEELLRRNVLGTNFTADRERARLLAELPGDVTTEGTPATPPGP